jgi:hypothetical protein
MMLCSMISDIQTNSLLTYPRLLQSSPHTQPYFLFIYPDLYIKASKVASFTLDLPIDFSHLYHAFCISRPSLCQ